MNVLEIQTEEVVGLCCEVCLLVSPRHFCAFSLPFFPIRLYRSFPTRSSGQCAVEVNL